MKSEHENRMVINVPFTIEYTERDNSMYSCFIPETNIRFSAKEYEDIQKKGSAMIKILVDHFNKTNQNVRTDNTDPIS